MAINRLLKDSKLTPQEIETLNRAFDMAMRALYLVDRNDPITDLVARKIIQVGATGVRDPVEISKIAVGQLGPADRC